MPQTSREPPEIPYPWCAFTNGLLKKVLTQMAFR
jgi:hypothetical protein